MEIRSRRPCQRMLARQAGEPRGIVGRGGRQADFQCAAAAGAEFRAEIVERTGRELVPMRMRQHCMAASGTDDGYGRMRALAIPAAHTLCSRVPASGRRRPGYSSPTPAPRSLLRRACASAQRRTQARRQWGRGPESCCSGGAFRRLQQRGCAAVAAAAPVCEPGPHSMDQCPGPPRGFPGRASPP